MKLTKTELIKLQFPALSLIVSVILATVLLVLSQQKKAEAESALADQNQSLNQARSRLQTSDTERASIITNLPIYRELIHQGFIGEERRIEWIDDLRTANQENKLFGISYSIGTQEVYKPAFSINVGNFILHRSVMKIEASLLHEEDFFTLNNALVNKHRAPFLWRDCVMNKLAANSNKFEPNLSLECDLDWLTLTEPVTSTAQ